MGSRTLRSRGLKAEDVSALYAADGAQLGLYDSGQIIGDLVLVESGG